MIYLFSINLSQFSRLVMNSTQNFEQKLKIGVVLKKKLWKLTLLTWLAEQEENQMSDILNLAVSLQISLLQ